MSVILKETALRLERLAAVFEKWADYHEGRDDSVTAQADTAHGETYRHCQGMVERFALALGKGTEADLADTLLDLEREAEMDDDEDEGGDGDE